jgi:CHASE2 domain-containing sensor protein
MITQRIEPPAYTELRTYTQRERMVPYSAVVAQLERNQADSREYARVTIRTMWIVAALLTAMYAWMVRQPLFAFPPLLVQVTAITVNGLCWCVMTSGIWFKRPVRPIRRRK